MTQLGAAITLVRSRLDEPTTKFYTDTELIAWINAGVKDISRRTELNQEKGEIAAAPSTQQYFIPNDCIRVHHVEYKAANNDDVKTLEYRDLNTMDEVWWSKQTQTEREYPAYYTLWGMPPNLAILLWPIPATLGTIFVYYYKQPGDTTVLVDELPLPMGWDDALVDYCEYNALRKARDPRWQEAKQLYEEKVATLYDLTRRYSDQSGTVVGGGTGHLPLWLVEGW